jgi:hypothetical protein
MEDKKWSKAKLTSMLYVKNLNDKLWNLEEKNQCLGSDVCDKIESLFEIFWMRITFGENLKWFIIFIRDLMPYNVLFMPQKK